MVLTQAYSMEFASIRDLGSLRFLLPQVLNLLRRLWLHF